MPQFKLSIVRFPFSILFLLACAIGPSALAQSRWQQWRQLNGPMRAWVAVHPFAAPFGQQVSLRALAIADSMRHTGSLGTDYNGGQLDAFRHGIWMALLVQKWPAWKAASLGRAYERGNRQDFKRGKLEDGGMQDAVAREMDLYNNKIGRAIGLQLRNREETELIQAIIQANREAKFCRIRKDAQGQSLDASGEAIPNEEWQGHWQNRRSLEFNPFIPEI